MLVALASVEEQQRTRSAASSSLSRGRAVVWGSVAAHRFLSLRATGRTTEGAPILPKAATRQALLGRVEGTAKLARRTTTVPSVHYEVAPAIDSRRAWAELQAWLPEMLDRLCHSEVFDRRHRPSAEQRGIYLFSEEGDDLYVGRTGITARTRRAGTAPSTSFRSRFDQHTQDGQPPWSAPFAMRLARAEAAQRDIPVPGDWWSNRKDHLELLELFRAAKHRIADHMEMRIVSFDDDELGIRSTIAEIYAHAMLGTPYNDFSPS